MTATSKNKSARHPRSSQVVFLVQVSEEVLDAVVDEEADGYAQRSFDPVHADPRCVAARHKLVEVESMI
jgi:hypothetical protein